MTPPKSLREILETFFQHYFKEVSPQSGVYQNILKEVEYPLLKATLKYVLGNQKKAAEILGINRNTLRKKLTEFGIDPLHFQP